MTKYGETNNFDVFDFTKAIENYLGGSLDYIIYNTKKPSPSRVKTSRKYYPELISPVKAGKDISSDKRFIGKNVLTLSGDIIHDPRKLARIILSFI